MSNNTVKIVGDPNKAFQIRQAFEDLGAFDAYKYSFNNPFLVYYMDTHHFMVAKTKSSESDYLTIDEHLNNKE